MVDPSADSTMRLTGHGTGRSPGPQSAVATSLSRRRRRRLGLSHGYTRRLKLGEVEAKLVFDAGESGCGKSVATNVIGVGRRQVCDARLRCGV